jgi:hypothetical protein
MADGPVLAPGGAPPAAASRPDPSPEEEEARWHAYEANPAPWWIALSWIGFFVFAVAYLILNLLE